MAQMIWRLEVRDCLTQGQIQDHFALYKVQPDSLSTSTGQGAGVLGPCNTCYTRRSPTLLYHFRQDLDQSPGVEAVTPRSWPLLSKYSSVSSPHNQHNRRPKSILTFQVPKPTTGMVCMASLDPLAQPPNSTGGPREQLRVPNYVEIPGSVMA